MGKVEKIVQFGEQQIVFRHIPILVDERGVTDNPDEAGRVPIYAAELN